MNYTGFNLKKGQAACMQIDDPASPCSPGSRPDAPYVASYLAFKLKEL